MRRVRTVHVVSTGGQDWRNTGFREAPVMGAKKVDRSTLSRLVDKGPEGWSSGRNLGKKYYARTGKHSWTAVDNATGDAWTEEFRTAAKARRWLTHEQLIAGTSLDKRMKA